MEGEEQEMSALPDTERSEAEPQERYRSLIPLPRHPGAYTVEDWLALPETRERIELIDGSLVVSPAPATGHALCAQRLVRILLDSAPDDVEVVEAANVRVREEGFIPDIVVAWAEPILANEVLLDSGDLLMAVEIVSPGNRKRDHLVKPSSYAAAGVPVFMRVELHGEGVLPLVEVFTAKEGEYVKIAAARAGQTLSLTEPYEIAFDPAVLTGPRR
ncbi:Uma2 family endonuclease [Planomonospora corallina]|uniref:Uma2 family endonuclease n=1 Tax=Planomonospora corallina TaxID=1806052 RepID=A0ABV8I9G9_9ACTN